MKLTFTLFLFFGLCQGSWAQETSVIRDTSYTTHSTLLKIRKDYPAAEPAVFENEDELKSQVDMVYHSIGDRKLHLDVHSLKIPNSEMSPGVILVHGGGWSSGDKSMLTPLAKQLAKNRFIAFNVEYRLVPEAPYPAAVIDIQNALRFIKNNSTSFGLDTSRIAILGCSAGAQLASLVGVISDIEPASRSLIFQKSGKVQAIVNVDGIVAFIHPESGEGKAASKWLGGSAEEKAETWIEASPLTYVSKETPPTLFINSSIPRFHAGRDDFISVLNENGTYSEVHTHDDSPHSFWLFHPWFHSTVEFTVNFLNKVFNT